MTEKIKIGISSCLLGNKVRYNGGHSHDRYLTQTLGEFLEYIPVCPEVECGMEVPRETIRLVGNSERPRLMTTKTKIDKTRQMSIWIDKKLKLLEKENLCGFIFKSKSPSSGLYNIKVYGDDGKVRQNGVGMFAKAFTERFPKIPVEEDGRLHDIHLRENFVEKIFILKNWRDITRKKTTPGKLVEFHTKNKLLLLSHNQSQYRIMGKLVASGKKIPVQKLFDEYENLLLKTMEFKTTPKKHINVLLHMMGYFKKTLSGDEKSELLESIEEYRAGFVPLIVPLTLIKHYVRKYKEPYLVKQTYLAPHPVELKLRSFI